MARSVHAKVMHMHAPCIEDALNINTLTFKYTSQLVLMMFTEDALQR